MKRTAIALVMTLLSALPVSAESLVEISDAWARATILTSRTGAAYLTITRAATDRLLEITGTVTDRDLQAQVLDDMELERERGITIKSHAIQMNYEEEGKKYDSYGKSE